MSKCSEAYQESQDDMQEYLIMEEMAYQQAIQDVKGFIESGAVTIEQVEHELKGDNNGNYR